MASIEGKGQCSHGVVDDVCWRCSFEKADAERDELKAWKESAMAALGRWHALGDELQKRYPLPLGVDIPTALLERLVTEAALAERLSQESEVSKAEPGWMCECGHEAGLHVASFGCMRAGCGCVRFRR
jgi:hypothetical protein